MASRTNYTLNSLGLLLALVMGANGMKAQSIINTSAISQDLDSTLSVILEVSGDFSRGNAHVDRLSTSGGVGWSISENTSMWVLGGYNSLSDNKKLIQEAAFIHARYNYELNSLLTFNFYGQIQSNSVIEIADRRLGGMNLNLFLNETQSASIAMGMFYELEDYNSGEKERLIRGNAVGVFMKEWKTLEVVAFAYYQPNVRDFLDYRCIGELSIRKSLFTSLQLGLNWASRYDSSPHSSLKAWDNSFNLSLRYKFLKA